MAIEEQLKDVILSQYKSCREFCLAHKIPTSTLASIFKRGINRASVDVIINICSALNIDVNALCDGKIKYLQQYPLDDILPAADIQGNLVVSIGRGGKRTVYKISDEDAAIVDAFLNKFKKD